MTQVTVRPGICGLQTQLFLTADEDQLVTLRIESACPQVRAMQDDLHELDGYEACFARYSTSAVYTSAEKHCSHLACPVPSAIIKGLEVACQLALPANVLIEIDQ